MSKIAFITGANRGLGFFVEQMTKSKARHSREWRALVFVYAEVFGGRLTPV